jgi:hypothetical protein
MLAKPEFVVTRFLKNGITPDSRTTLRSRGDSQSENVFIESERKALM